jgi:sucrose-6-phosphate hydrolase SacC (GH32 family)
MRHQLPDVAIGEDISCPNFFKLGEKWMLLCISHPLGCRYYLGDWDSEAEQFVPQKHGRMNFRREGQVLYGGWRNNVLAPESVRTPDGRRVMWAWLGTIGPIRQDSPRKDSPLRFKSIQSLPRELSLPADGILRIKPLRELESLRYDPVSLSDVTIENPITGLGGDTFPPPTGPTMQRIADLNGDAFELRIVIARDQAARKLFGFRLFADEENPGLPILLRPENGTLRVGTAEAPFAVADLPEGEDVELRIFIDKYLVEVFANDRQAMVAAHLDSSGTHGLDAFSVGATTTIKRLDMWKLKPTNQGFLDAQGNRAWDPLTEPVGESVTESVNEPVGEQ